MRFPLKSICKKTQINKDGCAVIYIQYCHSPHARTILHTGISIPPEFWDEGERFIKKNLPVNYGTAKHLNQELQRLIRIVEDLILFVERNNVPDPVHFIKKTFAPDFNPDLLPEKVKDLNKSNVRKNLDIYFQIDDYIQSKIKKVCKDMPRIYRNMKDHLKAFEVFRKEPVTFDSLDLNFYEEWVDFLTYDYVQSRRNNKQVGLKTNTIGKTIKQFRTFLRNRMRKRIIPPIDLDGWKILEVEVDAVYLSASEIKLIEEVDLINHPHLESYRNDFVLGCLTGLRFSDFSSLDLNDIKGNMLYKKQQKSDHWVVIPLRTKAKEILQSRLTSNQAIPTNAEFNRHIKTVAQLAGLTTLVKHTHKVGNKDKVDIRPKYAWITSHTCRRSFCTNEFLAGTPVELIMKISGHKSVKDFYKYIRISPEEAGNKIEQIWRERGEMV